MAQSMMFADSGGSATKIAPDALALSADFEGAIDGSLSTAYFCKGVASFIPVPTPGRPDNQALLVTLDPRKSLSAVRCDPKDSAERAELAEPDAMRLPLGTEVWYGFQFMVPGTMKGKFAGKRLVIAQLKQRPPMRPLGTRAIGLPAGASGNPPVSLRVIEDEISDAMGLQLTVSGDGARKIRVGQLMRHRGQFLDRWHQLLLHVRVIPPARARSGDTGFVEAWLDGQSIAGNVYSGRADAAESFGYSGLVGRTCFKFGIYRDRDDEPWSIAFDRFRRGATRQSVERIKTAY